jgi:ATP-binding cassette subfamily B protein
MIGPPHFLRLEDWHLPGGLCHSAAMEGIRLLIAMFGARRRAQLALTLGLMLAAAAAELVTIGATVPFLAVITGQGPVAARQVPAWFWFAPRPFVVAVLLLVGSAVAAAAIRLLLLWATQRLVTGLGHDIAAAIFARTLRQPYADFVRRNSSEILAGMDKAREVVSGVLQPAMQGLTGAVIATCIIALLFAVDPFAAAVAAVSVLIVYVALSLGTRGRLRRNSVTIAEAAVSRTKILQEGIGGIRDIILERSQGVFEAKFREIDLRFRRAVAANMFISTGPRFVVEAAGIATIALIAIIMSLEPGGVVKAIPVLGALALGAQRLMPLLQQVYNGWSQLAGNLQSLRDLETLVSAPTSATKPPSADGRDFSSEIAFRGVGFRYPGGRFALRNVDLVLPRGARIGVVGPTGGGKSTLLDLLMGLLDPSEGEIRIDGRRLDDDSRAGWQAQLAHVPQSIYLTDDTIAANVAFGTPRGAIDRDRVEAAVRGARLDGFVAELEHGLETVVGERGIRLSGGQRQRIGIARALYKRARVLILDEATSALDDDTEADVIRSIMGLGREVTLIMIAHRRSTLAGCDRWLKVEAGRVSEVEAL